jgi:hypothetical protein
MRMSYDTQIIRNDDGVSCGFIVKGDYCAEHQNGLDELHYDLGCGSLEIEGIERFIPSGRAIESRNVFTVSECKGWHSVNGRKKTVKKVILSGRMVDGIPGDGYAFDIEKPATSWFSSKNFVIASNTKEAGDLIRLIGERAQERDVAVFIGGGSANPFSVGGLAVVIPSLSPQEGLDTLREAHIDTRKLEEATVQTGIRDRIAAKRGNSLTSDFRLHALHPAWVGTLRSRGKDDLVQTDHPVIFCINNGNDIHGWYTVEELDQWISTGTGKVVDDRVKYRLERETRKTS